MTRFYIAILCIFLCFSGYSQVSEVKDINPGNGSGDPGSLVELNGSIYFSANDGTNGNELWISNGSDAGTSMVLNINPTGSGVGNEIVRFGNTLYFSANDGINGWELWKSDGTAAGTSLLKDINSGANSSSPSDLVVVGSNLFFVADNGTNGRELWKSDGTPSGTNQVIGSNTFSFAINELTDVDGTLYFVHGRELWRSDGTSAGTRGIPVSFVSTPTALTNVDGALFFAAAGDFETGIELWYSEGSNTSLVKDVNAGSGNGLSVGTDLVLKNVNGTLYFTADDGSGGRGIWRSNGLSSGTSLVLPLNNLFTFIGNIGDIVLFSDYDETTRRGSLIKSTIGEDPEVIGEFDGVIFGSINDRSFPIINNQVFFFAYENFGFSGNVGQSMFYTSDGSSSGTLLHDSNTNQVFLDFSSYALIGSVLYTDGVNGDQSNQGNIVDTELFQFKEVNNPIGLPATPSNVRITSTSSANEISWTDNSNNETGFEVYRNAESINARISAEFELIATLASNTTMYSDNNVSSKTTYKYAIRAINQAGRSGFSALASTSRDENELIITTVAGSGSPGFGGDGGIATSAQLNEPFGVAVDASGNLYIADLTNLRIRKVDGATGIITTVAGNGTRGYSGDGGIATSAQLNDPIGVAVDASGNLYIADQSNQRIRKVDVTTGIITTVAGNGIQGFSGEGGASTSAKLNNPSGVAVDASGNLYIADLTNQRIRKVDGATGIITTVAGNGIGGFRGDGGAAISAQFNGPVDVAVNASGNLYIADWLNQRIREVDGATGIITTVAGNGVSGYGGDGGIATVAQINNPWGVAVDVSGDLYIADRANNRIRKVDGATGIITTVAGDGSAGFSGDGNAASSAQLNSPTGINVDEQGNLYIADQFNHRIRKVSALTGEVSRDVGNTEVFADIGFNNNRKAIPVTMGEDGLIESISIFHEGGSGNMLLAVYTDNEGVPGARLGVTPLTPVAATQGWQTINLSSPVGAVNGQTVWLAWSFQSSTGIRFQENTSGRAKSPQSWSENMPADFGSSTLANFTFSVYATYSSFTPTLPNDPSELNATAQPDVSIEVSWVDNSDNESSFEIERSETSGNGFVAIATVAANTTTYTDNATSTNTEYFYRVRAVNSAGNSGYTTEASAITGEAPLVVGNTEVFADIGFNNNRKAIPVTMGEDGLIESISIFHEGGSGNMLLAVYTDNEGVPGARLGVTPLTPVAATQGWQTINLSSPVGAVNGQTVWLAWSFQSSTGIRFQENTSGRAKSPQSWSENMPADFGSSTLANFTFSVYATYSSFTPTLPNDPSELNATAQPDVSIEVSWVDNSDNESSFEIERSETSGNGFVAIATVAANTTTYTDNTTSTNTEYFYRVRAVNSAGNSGYTTEASAITGEAPLVVGNTEVFADIGFNNNRKAIPVTMGEDGLIESISIFHEGGSGNMLLAVYTDNEGVPGARLGVTPLTPVAATQGWQTIDLSSPVGAVNGQTVWLAWSFQSSTGIRFQENTSGRAKSPQSWSENMPADFGSSTLANFTFSVYATYSSFTPTLPNDPSELNATAQPDVSIEVSWVDNSDNESSFEIERSETSGNGFVAIATVAANTTTYTDNTTSTNTEYFYRVRAVNSAGNSGYTTEASAITGEAPLVVGNTEVFADIGFNNNRKAIPVTMGEDGLIESISIFHEGGSGNMLLAVYTDNEGVPGVRLGVTPLTPVAATQGWQTINLSSPVGAVNGQTVWLAWSFQSSTGIRFQENTSGRAKSPQSWSENMPADFGSSTLANFTFSVYATYSSSGTTPSSIAGSNFDAFGQEITPVVYPNPSGSTGFTYQFHSEVEGNAELQVWDMGGKLVYRNIVQVHKGSNQIQVTPNLKNGAYLLQLNINGLELQERISIQN